MPHAPDRCYQCGQVDDHPKMHVARDGEVRSFHHDCLPAGVLEENDGHPHLHRVVEAARSGTRGDELRAHIAALTEEG